MATDNRGLVGSVLGDCQLERLIGRGGMSSVYLGRQRRPARYVAIKVLSAPSGVGTQGEDYELFLLRFRREADIVAKLEHVNIIPLYAYGEENQLAYIMMPYISGGSLSDLINRQGKLSPQKALVYLRQAAAALDYAHARNVIHRDLKPSNFLLYPDDDRLVLADFGIARIAAQNPYATQETTLTQVGGVPGTLAYMAPEMLRDSKSIDYRVDIYALGIVLYQMLSGELPFKGDMYTLISQHISSPLPSLSQRDLAIPPAVDAVLRKATAKNRDERYSSASDFAEDFRIAASSINTQVGGSGTGAGAWNDSLTAPSASMRFDPREENVAVPLADGSGAADVGGRVGNTQPSARRWDNATEVPQTPQQGVYPYAARGRDSMPNIPYATQGYSNAGAVDATVADTPASRIPQGQSYQPAMTGGGHNSPPAQAWSGSAYAQPPVQRRRRGGGIFWPVLVLALVAGIGVFGFWSFQHKAKPPAPPTPTAAARQVITDYYDDINRQDYKAAYDLLTPEFQKYLPYESFARGYANTKHDDLTFGAIKQLSTNSVDVTTTIKALEARPQGDVTSIYHIKYRVVHRANGWKILSGIVT